MGVVRDQIDQIYQNDPHATTEASNIVDEQEPVTKPTAKVAEVTPGPGAVNLQLSHQANEGDNAYERTHDETKHSVDDASWRKYHSAWQSYYQQYYERYYIGQVHATRQELERQVRVEGRAPSDDSSLSTEEAMYDLRTKLRTQISARAQKVRKSRHFVPVLAAVVVMVAFLFLQYNRVVFAAVDAYVTPGNMDPSTLIVDPTAAGTVSSEPKLIIPKINVNVPIIWDANASSQDSLNAAMDKGVAWFNIQGASAKPGEVGNFVLSGHSSNDWLDGGDYKFIFARLEQLSEGDTIYVDYNSQRYVYTISRSQVVQPTDVSALTNPVTKPEITLVTCTPLGTATNRLLVFADQVSPDPAGATQSTTSTSTSTTASKMPSNSPTFLQRLFGISN